MNTNGALNKQSTALENPYKRNKPSPFMACSSIMDTTNNGVLHQEQQVGQLQHQIVKETLAVGGGGASSENVSCVMSNNFDVTPTKNDAHSSASTRSQLLPFKKQIITNPYKRVNTTSIISIDNNSTNNSSYFQSSSLAASAAVLPSATSTTLPCSNNSNMVNNDNSNKDIYDDGGIDWNSIPLEDYSHSTTTKEYNSSAVDNTTSDSKLSTTTDTTTDTTSIPSRTNNNFSGRNYLKQPNNNTFALLSAAATSSSSTAVSSNSLPCHHSPSMNKMATTTSTSTTQQTHPSSSMFLSRPPEWCSKNKNSKNNIAITSSANNSPNKLMSSSPSNPVAIIYNQEGKLLPPLPPELSYNPSRIQPAAVNEQHRCLVKHANISAPLKNGWKLMPHQKLAILKWLQMRRLVVAYDMGLGKTALACVWANAFQKSFANLKVLIIAPVSLQKEWKNTATMCTDLVLMEEDPLFGLEVASWGKIPQPPHHQFVVIADEAHSMQSITSQRTKETLTLLNDKQCVGCLLLTGTPMKNGKPANLFPLLRGVRHPLGDNQRAYETYFCNGHSKNFGKKGVVWDASGSSHLEQLHAHIASHVIHMTKEDCLEELPGKTREYRQIQVSSKFEYQYQAKLKELAAILHRSAADTNTNEDNSDALLGAFTRVRQISSFSKIDATVALARCILEKESSIVIFTCFVDVAKSVHQKLEDSGWSGELLTGQTPGNKRQEMVDNFQAGISSIFVCTFGAGGVGLTLTAACTIILLDRPWTPGDALQAEDRVRRIGQTKEVTSIWMRAFDIDKQIDDMIERKKQNSHTVVDGKSSSNTTTSNNNNAAKISIFQLVASIVPKPAAQNYQQLRAMPK